MELPQYPAAPLLGVLPKETQTGFRKDLHPRVPGTIPRSSQDPSPAARDGCTAKGVSVCLLYAMPTTSTPLRACAYLRE